MFENKFRDLLNRKPEIAEVMGSTSAMSEEERGLQLEKIGELKYLNHLLRLENILNSFYLLFQ